VRIVRRRAGSEQNVAALADFNIHAASLAIQLNACKSGAYVEPAGQMAGWGGPLATAAVNIGTCTKV
jgi:hypothetical protein